MKTAAGARMLAAGKSVVAGAGGVAGLLRGVGDGARGGWVAERVMRLAGGS